MFVIIGYVKVISESVVTILFRPAQLRNAIGIVILTFPFSRISTFAAGGNTHTDNPCLSDRKPLHRTGGEPLPSIAHIERSHAQK